MKKQSAGVFLRIFFACISASSARRAAACDFAFGGLRLAYPEKAGRGFAPQGVFEAGVSWVRLFLPYAGGFIAGYAGLGDMRLFLLRKMAAADACVRGVLPDFLCGAFRIRGAASGGARGVLPKRWRSGRGGKGGFYRSPAPASRSAGERFFHAGLIGNAERLCGGLRAESAF